MLTAAALPAGPLKIAALGDSLTEGQGDDSRGPELRATEISGVTFDQAWPSRMTVAIEGLMVPVIGRDDLLRNKAASGRPKDLADLAALGTSQATKKPSKSDLGQ